MGAEEFKRAEENLQRYKENVADLTQEFEIGLFLYLVNKIKWYAILILTISFIFAFLYLRYTPETYQTNALVQVAVQEKPSGFSDLYSYNINTNLNSEIALMKSQKAIERVIEDLDLKIFYYFEGEVLTRFLYNQSSFRFSNYSIKDQSIISKPIYLLYDGQYFSLTDEKEEVVYAKFILPNKFFSSKYLSGTLRFSSENWKENLNSMSSNERLFFRIPHIKEIKNSIINGLTININNQSAHSIQISHQHTNPYFSMDICNSIVKIYMNYEINKKQKVLTKLLII